MCIGRPLLFINIKTKQSQQNGAPLNKRSFSHMANRDKTIDYLRATAMLWVILIHVLYWGAFFVSDTINLIKSFLLLEMPLFFFVTGASNSFSKTSGYFSFVFKRYKRVLIPYWVFALLCAGLSIIDFNRSGTVDFATVCKILLSWIIPNDKQMTNIPYMTWSLWFIPVYLCVILVIPLLKRMRNSKHSDLFIIVLLFLFVSTCYLNFGRIRSVVFYSFWTYIGLFYNKITLHLKERNFRKSLVFVALIGISGILGLYTAGMPLDMQSNKAPPNLMFFVFSVVNLSLIFLLIPFITKLGKHIEQHKLPNRILVLFSTRTMTIFLYQSFAFYITIRYTNMLIPGIDFISAVIKSILCLIATVMLCAVFAIIFGKIEDIGSKRPPRTEKEWNNVIKSLKKAKHAYNDKFADSIVVTSIREDGTHEEIE